MKVKSEFYISELLALLNGIEMQVGLCAKLLRRETLKTKVLSFLMPWRAASMWSTLSINAQILDKHVKMMSELREKILISEGFDDDMQPITLNEIFSKQSR